MKKTSLTHPLTCRECRDFIPAYTQRELATLLRHRVGAHLDGCTSCSAVYRAQRDVTRDLRGTLPAIGVADTRRLNGIWTAIQQEMARPRRRTPPHPRRISASALVVVAALMLTLSLGANRLALALPVPPTPAELAAQGDGDRLAASRTEAQIAMISDLIVQPSPTPASGHGSDLTVTPPGAPRYAPTVETTPTEMP